VLREKALATYNAPLGLKWRAIRHGSFFLTSLTLPAARGSTRIYEDQTTFYSFVSISYIVSRPLVTVVSYLSFVQDTLLSEKLYGVASLPTAISELYPIISLVPLV
jgi:hypothetical protein